NNPELWVPRSFLKDCVIVAIKENHQLVVGSLISSFIMLETKYTAENFTKICLHLQSQQKQKDARLDMCAFALILEFMPHQFRMIDKIFDESTTTKKIIDLYTIHSGKGGEGHYTFIIYPEQMPIEFEKQSREERQQEQHMIYVSLTRCLARAKGGILWLVLAAKGDAIKWPKWLPHEYRKLWKEDKAGAFEPDFEDLGYTEEIDF
ncbi:MAG: hypothetical protein AAGA80_28960, partial [Cyanobacteria bacterium P01_F01_bin.143]